MDYGPYGLGPGISACVVALSSLEGFSYAEPRATFMFRGDPDRVLKRTHGLCLRGFTAVFGSRTGRHLRSGPNQQAKLVALPRFEPKRPM